MTILSCPSGSRCNTQEALEIPERPCIAWEHDDTILKQDGMVIWVIATTLKRITNHWKEIEISTVATIFKVEPWKVVQPAGWVDLLIGIQAVEVFPKIKAT